MNMKLSVSIPDQDVEFLDQYGLEQGINSRSAVFLQAIRLLRTSQLGPAYAEAWSEWSLSGDEELWDTTSGDGVE